MTAQEARELLEQYHSTTDLVDIESKIRELASSGIDYLLVEQLSVGQQNTLKENQFNVSYLSIKDKFKISWSL